jgi:hypothetical protein
MAEQVKPQVCVGGGGRRRSEIDLHQDDLGAYAASVVVYDRRDQRRGCGAVVRDAQPR